MQSDIQETRRDSARLKQVSWAVCFVGAALSVWSWHEASLRLQKEADTAFDAQTQGFTQHLHQLVDHVVRVEDPVGGGVGIARDGARQRQRGPEPRPGAHRQACIRLLESATARRHGAFGLPGEVAEEELDALHHRTGEARVILATDGIHGSLA